MRDSSLYGTPASSTGLSALLDAGASGARLDQLARMTASKFWFRQDEDDIGRRWTFMFKGKGKWIYTVIPIFRGRYFAVVRAEGADVVRAGKEGGLEAEDIEVRSVSVFEVDALKLACADVAEEP